uniref:Lactamase_B domain-containing protein n=1 Tax=Caenorhabditis tropicalis TaxID=1561998 RepID=A0A1I7TG63_9PELO
MAECHVIIQGRPNDDPLGATGTVGLIIDGTTVILIDAGDPWNGSEILEKLQSFPCTVNHVVVTHGHLDHCANLGMFPNATIIMDWDIGRRSKENPKRAEYSVIPQWPFRISDNCEIMNLSGHTASDTIAIVQNCKNKIYVVYAGDLIEDSQDLTKFEDLQLELLNSEEENELLSSQEFIFGAGDIIIPGHGIQFKNSDRLLFLFFSFWRRFM